MERKGFNHFYQKYAALYDQIYLLTLDPWREVAVEVASVQPGEAVLEVGVGTALTARFYPKNCSIVGIDCAGDMLKRGQKRVEKLGVADQYQLLHMDACQLAFPDDSFDVVLGAHFLSATPKPHDALKEMKRVCKPTGRIVLVNAFKSDQGPMNIAQKILDPLTKRIGFSCKLSLESMIEETPLEIHSRKKISQLFPVEAAILLKQSYPA